MLGQGTGASTAPRSSIRSNKRSVEARAWRSSGNLKSGVTKACFYDPEVNRSYAEMAAHYGTAIVPARHTSRATKPRSRWPCYWPRAGSSPSCAIAGSSRSPS
jgi:hypothetical protein